MTKNKIITRISSQEYHHHIFLIIIHFVECDSQNFSGAVPAPTSM